MLTSVDGRFKFVIIEVFHVRIVSVTSMNVAVWSNFVILTTVLALH